MLSSTVSTTYGVVTVHVCRSTNAHAPPPLGVPSPTVCDLVRSPAIRRIGYPARRKSPNPRRKRGAGDPRRRGEWPCPSKAKRSSFALARQLTPQAPEREGLQCRHRRRLRLACPRPFWLHSPDCLSYFLAPPPLRIPYPVRWSTASTACAPTTARARSRSAVASSA